jgi:transcriptional regulator with XRE-family HTH domain
MQAMAREAETRLRLAQQLHDLREQAGLTQREVAERAGTSRSVIARLEQPGYEKHTLSTLRRVAGAMGFDVRVEFVPAKAKPVRRAGSAAPRAKPT